MRISNVPIITNLITVNLITNYIPGVILKLLNLIPLLFIIEFHNRYPSCKVYSNKNIDVKTPLFKYCKYLF